MGGPVSWVRAGARHHPARTAIETDTGAVRSYADLDERSTRLAHGLLAQGLVAGDRVALWMDNCLEYVDAYLACARARLVVVPLNIRFTPAEAGHVLQDSGARVLIHSDVVQDQVAALALSELSVVAVGAALEQLVSAGSRAALPEPDPQDLLVLGYTSGTTGAPKGAELTHASIERLALTNALSCRYRLGSVHVFAMSLSFTATVPAHVLPHLMVGGTTVLHRTWETDAVLDSVRARKGSFLIAPTPVLSELSDALRARPSLGDSLVTVLHSASKAPPALLGGLVDVLGDRVVEGWGMTENSGGLFTASAPGQLARDLSTSGVPVPGCEVRVVDPEPDGTGMLAVRAGSLFRGYWRDPASTAAALDADGWFLTGDLGTVDDAGAVTVVDRRHDLINSGGMNVYPSEVERVLSDCPDVVAVAVVGAPHERWGQVPVAFVVPAPGVTATDRMVEAARAGLAAYKRPTRIELVADLPRNTSGKVLRGQLRDRFA